MKKTFINKLKVFWHVQTCGFLEDCSYIETNTEVFCLCGFGDDREPIKGMEGELDKRYRRLAEDVAYSGRDIEIPN